MAEHFKQSPRRVIPNWRDYRTTATLGELDGCARLATARESTFQLTNYEKAWQDERSIAVAGDLISSFWANGAATSSRSPILLDAANFIIMNNRTTPAALVSLANDTILPPATTRIHTTEDSHTAIHKQREYIRTFPHNPIAYVELARFYAIVAHKDQALRAMRIALNLCPENRFILRSAIRLFAHFRETEAIYKLIIKRDITKHDPWVIASGISLSMLLEKPNNLAKRAIEIAGNTSYAPFDRSELQAAIATLEFNHGSTKKARSFLRESLVSPNDNSLAQAEWLNSQHFFFPLDISQFNVMNDFEALSYDYYRKENWQSAINNANRWFADMPYVRKPILFASHIASSALNDNALAASLTEKGIESHPHDALLKNNLAYYYLLNNDIVSAEKILSNTFELELTKADVKACLTATRGLMEFRKGNTDKARSLYSSAIELAKELPNKELFAIATLNYAREELTANPDYLNEAIGIADTIFDKFKSLSVKALRESILQIAARHKSQS